MRNTQFYIRATVYIVLAYTSTSISSLFTFLMWTLRQESKKILNHKFMLKLAFAVLFDYLNVQIPFQKSCYLFSGFDDILK